MGSVLRNIAAVAFFALAGAATAQDGGPAEPSGVEFFEKRIRPLFVENCQECHGAKKQESGLVLNSAKGIVQGGDRGPAIVAGQPEESLLIQAVRYTDDDLKMPPRGKLKDEQIADLVAWVKMGAPTPKEGGETAVVRPSEFDLAERRKHWAYQAVGRPLVPQIQNSEFRIQNSVDAFIAARLRENGLSPAPQADKRTLIRRVTFDLTGLPPTSADVQRYFADLSPDAYERLVDRLLALPQYGERWGRHWLDVVRYSETMGFEFDYDLYNAWRYRDYVIRAFNADLPYDQFVIEHLAGDLVLQPRRHATDDCNESILATGFFWMVEGKQTPVDIRQEQADRIDNQIDALSKALLAQTVACARCHDHKFDAITTRDYYALAGYLKSSRYQQAFIDQPGHVAEKVKEIVALKTRVGGLPRSEVAAEWRGQLEKASKYLLAARTVERKSPAPEKSTERGSRNAEQKDTAGIAKLQTAIEEAARELGIEAALLEKWVKALRLESVLSMDHPLYAWKKLTAEAKDATVKSALAEQQTKAIKAAAVARSWEDFRKPGYGGWYVTGDAFALGPAKAGDVMLGGRPERPVARVTSGGADSGLIAARLQGELRSPTFTIEKRYVHLRVAGDDARVNLVIDGNTLIMNPMYGKLTVPLKGEGLIWWTMPVDRWVGHRAYLEVSDCTIPPHRLNPPPSTARVPEGIGEGYVVLDQVIFSDEPEPPLMPNRANLAVLERSTEDQVDNLAGEYQDVMIQAVERWSLEQTDTDQDGLVLLNWFLENGLLDAPAEKSKLAQIAARYREASAALPLPERAPALADGTGEDEFVFLRGNYRALGERARRGPLDMLGDVHEPIAASKEPVSFSSESSALFEGSGRLDLARKLVDPSNPLVSRVIVNRLWQHHFGAGIVRTPDDFGRMGLAPSHPELLDWLASELVRKEWSLKAMQRRMVESSTYRQRSVNSEFRIQNSELISTVDPENRLLHCMPIRRLEAEAVRDSILAVSGRLNLATPGPSVLPYLTPYMEGRGRPVSGPLDSEGRRSVYVNARRNFLTPLLLAFDYPVTFTSIGRRSSSTIPAQALTLMNDPFVVQQAGVWAERMLQEAGSSVEQRIESLYQSAFSRPPTEDEVREAIDFLQEQSLRHGTGSEDPRVWTDLCHVLINVKEFIFIE